MDSIVFNRNPGIRDYDEVMEKIDALFASTRDAKLDDQQTIVDEIFALATGRNQKFRTLVGKAAHDLMALRKSVPIEEYLSTIAARF